MDSADTSRREARKRSESVRKKRYRATKRLEYTSLVAECRALEGELERLKSQQNWSNPGGIVEQTNVEIEKLRKQVDIYGNIIRLLELWVISQTPLSGISMYQTIGIRSSLVDQPDTRQFGYKWLAEREYYKAIAAYPRHPLGHDIVDTMYVDVHTEEGEDGPEIVAMETNYQFTAFFNHEDVASACWDSWLASTPVISCHRIDSIDSNLVYYHHVNNQLGTNMRSIASRFTDSNRAIITHSMVANDERYPLTAGEIRVHGYAWTIFERIADSVTLVRSTTLQCAPVTTNSQSMPLRELGKLMFGQSFDDFSINREAFIEEIRAHAEATYRTTHQSRIQTIYNVLNERSQLKDSL